MNIFVTGTDTSVGKTVVSTILAIKWEYAYWKPIQTGAEVETDSEFVAHRIGKSRVYNPIYIFKEPLSPHQAAKKSGSEIRIDHVLRQCPKQQTLIEGTGGPLVPINETELVIDLMVQINGPVIVVSRSTLGTINHTLLALEALRRRSLHRLAVVMVGPCHPENRQAIEKYGGVPVLAEIPLLEDLSHPSLIKLADSIEFQKEDWKK